MREYRTMNADIRQYIHDAGLHNYQVARVVGYSEAQFYRILREELSENMKAMILQAVDYLVETEGVMING